MSGKRLFDVVFSLTTLIVLSPLFLLLALAVKSFSEGPIFYRCRRVGLNGKAIFVWKLRTMTVGSANRLEVLLDRDPALKEEYTTFRKLKKDPRVTTIGRFLRRTSLDELPQFWNVLRGDLSVVGPRPAMPEEVAKHRQIYFERILIVKPGITGLWQVAGRSLLTFDQRVALEATYASLQSFWLDCKIILQTLPALFGTRAAC